MTHPDEPAEHDAYLRSALRHAPDAALVPSDALNEAILLRARSATASVSRPSLASTGADVGTRSNDRGSRFTIETTRWRRLAALWAWLGQPAVATGFAGLMVATLVGVMWWDRPLDEAMPPRTERRAAADLAARASAPAGKVSAEAQAFDPAEAAGVPTQASDVDAQAKARKTDRVRQDNPIAMADQPRQSVRQAPSSPAPVPEPSARSRMRAEPGGSAGSQSAVPPLGDAATAERVPQAFPSPAQRLADALNGAPEAARKSRAAEPSAMAESPAARGRVAEAPGAPGLTPAHAPTPAPSPMPAHAEAQPEAPAAAPRARALAKAEAQAPSTAQAQEQTQMPGTPSREAPLGAAATGTTPGAGPVAPVQPGSESAARAAPSRRSAAVGNAEPHFDQRREPSRSESSPDDRLALRELSKSTALRTGNSQLSTLRAAVATEPSRWTWTTEDGSVRPVSSELQRWLARLDAAAAAFADTGPAAAGSVADPKDALRADRQAPVRTLTLLRDGQRHTTLRIGDSVEAIVGGAGSGRWQARLAPREAAALRSSVPDR